MILRILQSCPGGNASGLIILRRLTEQQVSVRLHSQHIEEAAKNY
jgi:hypothetical protein